jgi:hypothetical protein
MDQLMRDKIADSLKDFHLWTDMIRSGEAEVTGLTIKRKPKALPDNADISYIMSCSNDEFEQVTGVRLSANAWDRWSDDMDRRTEQLLALFVKAVKAEREACAKVCESEAEMFKSCAEGANDGRYDWKEDGARDCAYAIRARGKT